MNMNDEIKTQTEISNPGLPTIAKPNTIMKKITATFTRNGSFDMSKSVLPANQAYLKARYGHADSNEVRLDNFLKDLTSDITSDRNNGKAGYALVKLLPPDLVEYKEGIIELYRAKGYSVADLKDCVDNIDGDYIFLCWDKFDASRDKLESK